MKRALFFGDSLTYGQVPGTTGEKIRRYNDNVRWTGLLSKKLGTEWTVIEEGLPSRTIDLDDPRPGKQGKNGSLYIRPCIESHAPLDYVVVWLGTNDTKIQYAKTADEIVNSMRLFIDLVKECLSGGIVEAKIMLVSPPPFDEDNALIRDKYSGSLSKISEIAKRYKKLSSDLNLEFVDLYSLLDAPKSADGIHLTESQNAKVADIFYKVLMSAP